MSIDFVIIPSIARNLVVSDLLESSLSKTPTNLKSIMEVCNIKTLGSNQLLNSQESLEQNRFYFFEMSKPNTIHFGVNRNDSINLSIEDFIEDFGRNLSQAKNQELKSILKTVEFTYWITSMGGRPSYEIPLVKSLLTSACILCKGWIVLQNTDIFDIGVGIYTKDEFESAKIL